MAQPVSDIPGEVLVLKDCPSITQSKQRSVEGLLPILKKVLDITKLSPVQERFVAAAETGLDVFLVGPEDPTGLPIYLVPLLGHIIRERCFIYNTTSAPCAIILCSSIKRGNELVSKIRQALQIIEGMTMEGICVKLSNRIKLVEDIERDDYYNMADNPIDILILTGHALSNIFTSPSNTRLCLKILLHRLKYVVIEELFMNHTAFSEQATRFLRYLNLIEGGKELKVKHNSQLLLTGTVWVTDTEEIHSLLMRNGGRNSIKIFGSPIHAFQFRSADVEWKVFHASRGYSEKLKILVELCKEFKDDMSGEEKLVVVACSSSELAREVSYHLSKEGRIKNVLKTKNNDQVAGIFQKHFDWLGSIYVVSDDALENLSNRNAACVIHFDIGGDQHPASEPFFQKRHSCMWNRLNLESEKEEGMEENLMMTYFLVTGREQNFPTFYTFLQTVKIEIPKSLELIGIEKLAEERLQMPLCTTMKCFGLCNIKNCPERHEISCDDLEKTPDGPEAGGEVAFRVVAAVNPSLYLGRLTNHYVFDDSDRRVLKKDYKTELRERAELMKEYYSDKRNVKRPDKLSVDELYGLPLFCQTNKSPTYVRVKLGKEPTPSAQHGFGEIEVFSVDSGITVSVQKKHVLLLPQPYQQWPRHCVQVVLTNLLPRGNGNNEYLSSSVHAAKSWTEGKTWQGRVLLSIRDTIWINPMVELEKDPVTGQPSFGRNLICEYVSDKVATILGIHNHMMIMLEHIRKRDPSYPETVHEFNIDGADGLGAEFYGKVKGDPTEWLSLPVHPHEIDGLGDGELSTLHKVMVHGWVNPWEIYATLAPSEEDDQLLLKLESEMSKYIEESFLPKHFMKTSIISKGESNIIFGTVVAVRMDDGKWHRAIALRTLEEEDVSIKFDVFLVDYGITLFGVLEVEEVVPLMRKFVDVLPFQTMCLKLAHIQPLGENNLNWNMEDIKWFTDLLTTSMELQIFITGKTHGTNHPCNYYEAVAFQQLEHGSLQEIGIQLVKAEVAQLSQNCEDTLSLIRAYVGEKRNKEAQTDSGDLTNDNFTEDESTVDDSLENWENFLDEAEEVEEPGPSIKETPISASSVDSFNFTPSTGSEDDDLQQEIENAKDDPFTYHLENVKMYDSHEVDDDDYFYDALEDCEKEDGDMYDPRLALSPEEVKEMKDLCEWFLKRL